ncbi:MAG TPA: class I SAM-dependent RNA methyltransferase [Chthoniobacter sp.]|nr:class I SAM-dependent RNA methyltransferase [Chthoniobacter sp.]
MPDSTPLSLEVHDVAFGGKGVARHDGKVYFVPFTIPGEKITARVLRQKKNFGEAELVKVETASPDRVEPPCPYFGECGGCSYQHITYARQLEIKAAQVEQTLRRVGRLESVPMRPAIAAPQPFGYRNRIRVHSEGGVTGFYAHDARVLVDIEQCLLAVPEVNRALRRLRATPVREGDFSLRAPGGGPFFEQTNPEVAGLLVEAVRTVARGTGVLVDAYCGAGLFARALADRFEKVIGIEENPAAVESARRSAQPHESYVAGEVSAHLGEVLAANEAARTTLLLDPPTEGLAARVSDLVLGAGPSEVIYVSCNPGTLARDLALLRSSYELVSVTPLDMFPQTAEIEVVAHLVRR